MLANPIRLRKHRLLPQLNLKHRTKPLQQIIHNPKSRGAEVINHASTLLRGSERLPRGQGGRLPRLSLQLGVYATSQTYHRLCCDKIAISVPQYFA